MSAWLAPLRDADLDPADRERVATATAFMGFDANDVRTMARVPGLLAAMASVVDCCYRPGRVDAELKRLVAHVSSRAAGCQYCEAHTAHGVLESGIDPRRLQDVWSYETSDRFSAAEKVALRFAVEVGAGGIGNHDELRQFFDADEAAELLAILSLFAFLNRWNRTAQTELEAQPEASLATTRSKREMA
ncbi:MAG: carboxymuconolactone decarboxylase family protein [Pseudomonadota bacterium]